MKKIFCVIVAVILLAFSALYLASCHMDNSFAKYIIYSDVDFAPFEFLDEKTGKYTGVDMEILSAIAKDRGFEYEVCNEGFKMALSAVESGQADGMIAGMTITEERKQTFDFSDGYFEDGQVLVVKRDSDISSEADLAGKTVAVKNGTMGLGYAESIAEKTGFTISYYDSSSEMYMAVINGVNDACFEDFSAVCWAIEKEDIALWTVGEVLNPSQYGFAVKKGENAKLLKLFNEGLKNIRASGEYEEILKKYGY